MVARPRTPPTTAQTTYARLATGFRSPPDDYGPNPAWWWTGGRLDHDRLEWQMRQFHAGGLRQVTVISLAPHGPAHGYPADDPPFYSDEWWDAFRHVARLARELSMKLWYFDHLGVFPTRFPGELVALHPDYRSRSLNRGPRQMNLPIGAKVIAQIDDFVYYDEPLREYYSYATPGFVDPCKPEAGGALIDAIHGEMERRLGDLFEVIGGSFQDELRPLPSWTERLPYAFRCATGRDLVDCLPALFDPIPEDPDAYVARIAYHHTLARLAEEAFFRPLHDWHDERGLLVVCDQLFRARTGDPLAGTLAYADYARTHRWFSGIGNDHNGAVKVHSSLAHLYERPRVFFEAFHSSGWGGTLEETFHWLLPWLQRGSTHYGPHAIYYTTKGSWLEWAPPSTGFRQPYWRHYPDFARTVARLCWLLSQGSHRCDVAVLYPASAVQGLLPVDAARYDVAWRTWRRGADRGNLPPDEAEEIARVFWEVVGGCSWRWHGTTGRDDGREWQGVLDQIGVDFDVIDEDSLARAGVRGGRIAAASESYSTLVFPNASFVPRKALDRALELATSGGRVVFVGCLPRGTVEGGLGDPHLVRALHRLLEDEVSPESGASTTGSELPGGGEAVFVADAGELAIWLSQRLQPHVRGPARALRRQVGDLDVFLIVPDGLALPPPDRGGTITAPDAGDLKARIDQALSREPAPEVVTVEVRAKGPVQQWDPLTGEARPARVLRSDGEWTTVRIGLTSAPVGVLVFGHEAVTASPEAEPKWTEVTLADEWACELVPTADNRYGDLAWPPSDEVLPVETRVLRMVEGGSDGNIVCGFGPYVEVAGPIAPDETVGLAAVRERTEMWRPAEYSTGLGMEKDPVHRQTLGPRAHVPPEFVDLGQPPEGSVCLVRTQVVVPGERRALLRIAATGAMSAWLGGRLLGTGSGEMVVPVCIAEGPNELLIALAAPGRDASGAHLRLRAGFHFLPFGATPPYGHTLPDVPDWLNREGPVEAIDGLALDPHPELAPRVATYSCRVPPGARAVRVACPHLVGASLDGDEIVVKGSPAAARALVLPDPGRLGRMLKLRCELPVGVMGGGAFAGPLEFECGPGTTSLGSWRDQGLPHFVGGVRYGQTFRLDRVPRRLVLDLGRVRGTAEVSLNGEPCGTRIWSPYRFDISDAAREGENRLVVTVFGTLGNYYMEGHPSPYGLRSQSVLGLLGPVTLRRGE